MKGEGFEHWRETNLVTLLTINICLLKKEEGSIYTCVNLKLLHSLLSIDFI